MRPTRLEIEGFTTFRHPTVIDFEDADLFALTGPTGSGKSSVIDAMIFALYGCIPRLDQKAVAPIVSLGANEARIRLNFTVAGEGYTAVRIVRRPKSGKGASTKEARLERGADGEVLAGNQQELTVAVEGLLGLQVGDFTKCVVLPQGAFQEFLHATGKDRQDLLVKLLDLGIYDHMARLARQREGAASQQAEVAAALMAKLAFATPDARSAAALQVRALTELRAAVDATGPELVSLQQAQRDARSEARSAAERAAVLATVIVPDGLTELGATLLAAQETAAATTADEEEAVARAEQAEAAQTALPGRRRLEAALDAHRTRVAHLEQRDRAVPLLAERQAAEHRAGQAHTAAEAAVVEAQAALEQARWAHRAHDLASSLVAGEACPVCQQAVADLPDLPGQVKEIGAAEAARAEGQAVAQQAWQALSRAETDRRDVEVKLASIVEQVQALAAELADWPDQAPLEQELAAVEAAEQAERQCRQAAGEARRAALAARKAVDELRGREAGARRRFNQARADAAALAPPPCDGVELIADWRVLAGWAVEQRPVQEAAAETAQARAAQAESVRAGLEDQLSERCRGAGVDLAGRAPGDAVADALARAAADLRRIEEALAEAAEHHTDAIDRRRAAHVAHELARHLSANHFEKWLLDEALAVLVARATELLHDLSRGAYSLALDPDSSNFTVIDHRNADQVRSARTLSGGETFLASLALALALADQLGSLAAHGSAHLESIFLDEGFGTLDPDTLDTVVSAIEELGARGRMVGLVSHVADLAERVPVRFEVRREPAGSTVTKVVA